MRLKYGLCVWWTNSSSNMVNIFPCGDYDFIDYDISKIGLHKDEMRNILDELRLKNKDLSEFRVTIKCWDDSIFDVLFYNGLKIL